MGLFSLLQVGTAGFSTVSYCIHHTAQRAASVIHHLTGLFSLLPLLQVRTAGFYTVFYCTHSIEPSALLV